MAIVDLRLFEVIRYGVTAAALGVIFFQVKQRTSGVWGVLQCLRVFVLV